MAKKKNFYCETHDSVISCSLCEGIFEGSLKELAQRISDHEVQGKLSGMEFKFELFEYGEREGSFSPAFTKEYIGGRQVVGKWLEIEPNKWVREEVPQKWVWYD